MAFFAATVGGTRGGKDASQEQPAEDVLVESGSIHDPNMLHKKIKKVLRKHSAQDVLVEEQITQLNNAFYQGRMIETVLFDCLS